MDLTFKMIAGIYVVWVHSASRVGMIWLCNRHSLKCNAGIIALVSICMRGTSLNSSRLIRIVLVLFIHCRNLKVKARCAPGIIGILMFKLLLLIAVMHWTKKIKMTWRNLTC